ncbi:MAG: hypothetical protein HY849_01690 [Nitrosomonadales bacterium]|nr:hypothetical protein [Nitrosomonadales bacterium]
MRYVEGKTILLLITLFIPGCVYYRTASQLSVDESRGWKNESWVYSGVRQNWLHKDGISLMIRPHNYGEYSAVTVLPVPLISISPRDTHPKAFFAVTLVFDSGVNTWKGVPQSLKFNPYKVELRRQDGSVLMPLGYVRPVFNNFRCYNFDYEDPSLVSSIEYLQRDKWLEFPDSKNGRCFYLIYDTPPPSPAETFLFRINELELDGESLKVPELVFREGMD